MEQHLEVSINQAHVIIREVHFRVLFQINHVHKICIAVDIHVPYFTACEPYLTAIEIRRSHEVADNIMRHIKKQVVLLHRVLHTVVFELRPATRTDQTDSVLLCIEFTAGNASPVDVLYHYKIVTFIYPISALPVSRRKFLDLHPVPYLLSGVQSSIKTIYFRCLKCNRICSVTFYIF